MKWNRAKGLNFISNQNLLLFAQCSPFTCSLSLSPTNWSCCDSINNHFVYLPGHKVRPDQTRVKNWKGFTFFPLPDTASPFPVLEYLLWGSLYEPATKSFARIFVGPIIRFFVSDTARALCLTNDCCTKHQTMLRLWGKAKEEEVNSEKGSTPFDLIPCDWRREGRDVSEPLRRPNPNALIEVVF